MAKYHFEVRTNTHVRETVQKEATDHHEVRSELACFVGQLMVEHASVIWTDEEWDVYVTDDTGLILYSMHVSASRSAATISIAE